MSFVHDHLKGGVLLDPRIDPAFPPVAYSYSEAPSEGMAPTRYLALGGRQYQADAGSCTAHGYSAAVEAFATKVGASLQLCRQDMYYGARWIEGGGAERVDNGAFPSNVRRWLYEYGTVPEARKAYAPHDVTTWRPDPSWAADRLLLNCRFDPVPMTVDAILHELGDRGMVVVICHTASAGIDRVGADGIERYIPTPDRWAHCRAVTGYDRVAGVFEVMNWWRSWGVARRSDPVAYPDSFSYMPFADLVNPAFLQSADVLAIPPVVAP